MVRRLPLIPTDVDAGANIFALLQDIHLHGAGHFGLFLYPDAPCVHRGWRSHAGTGLPAALHVLHEN